MWEQEPEQIDARKVLVVFGVTSAILAVCVVVSAALQDRWQGALIGSTVPLFEDPVGIPPSDLLSEARPETLPAEALESWQWVDRDRGLVAMPIDVAMERVVEANR